MKKIHQATTATSAPTSYHVTRSTETGLITASPSALEDGPTFVLTALQALCLGAELVRIAAPTTAYAVQDAFKMLDLPGVSDHDRTRKAWAHLERVT